MAAAAAQLVLFPAVVNSIATLTGNVYGLISSLQLANPHTVELKALLEKSDVETTVQLVQHILADLAVLAEGSKADQHPAFRFQHSLVFALEKLREIITLLEVELTAIREKLAYNASLYLCKTLRSIDCSVPLHTLETHISILEKRMFILFKILKV